jgi:hypothetical protein
MLVRSKDTAYRERALSNDDQWTIDEAEGLSRGLEGLALLGDHLDVGDNLSRCSLRHDGSSHGQSRKCEVAERNHIREFGNWNEEVCSDVVMLWC